MTAQTCLACHEQRPRQAVRLRGGEGRIAHPTSPSTLLAAVGKRTAMVSTGFADLEAQYGTARSKGGRRCCSRTRGPVQDADQPRVPPGRPELYAPARRRHRVSWSTRRGGEGGRDPRGRPADGRDLQPRRPAAYVSNRLDDSVSVIDVATRKVVRPGPGRRRAPRRRTDRGQDALRAEHVVRRHLGHRRRDAQGDEAPLRQPQPVVAGALARRPPPARHERALALRAGSASRRSPR